MSEKRRCHFTHIFELFAKNIWKMIILAVALISSVIDDVMSGELSIATVDNMNLVVILIIIALILAIMVINLLYCVFKWAYTYVSMQDNTLIYESGKIVKKRVAIPFDKINTIDMGRNIFERLVGTCRLKVDTGAYSTMDDKNNAEMNLVFKLEEAEQLRSYILSRAAVDDDIETAETGRETIKNKEPDWAIRAGMADFMLYGLTSSSVWRLFWLILLGVCFIGELSTSFLEYIIDIMMPFAEAAMETAAHYSIIPIIIFSLIIAVLIGLISNICTVVWAAVRFYNFRVAREGRNIIVRYGLFTEKNYTLQVRNIHAVTINQNLFQQILGRCSVEAVCMGFGDEETETALLFPIIKKERLNKLLEVILPEYITEIHMKPRKKAGLLFHIVTPVLFWTIIGTAVCILCSTIMDSVVFVVVLAIIIVLMRLVNGILSYLNTTLDWNNSVVSVQSGGMHKTLYRIRSDAVQEVQIKSGPIARIFGIGTYYVHYHGPSLNNTSLACDLSNEYFAALADTVED